MSYYQKNKFIFTHHAIQRAKQRIKEFDTLSDMIIKVKMNKIINNNSNLEISDSKYDYYHIFNIKNKYMYIVVLREKNLVITITEISHNKKINIYKA